MKLIARSNVTASILVIGGFVAWLSIGRFFGEGWLNWFAGSIVFFAVACFLPETRPVTFLSRRSSLGLVGLFLWMAGSQFLLEHPIDSNWVQTPIQRLTIEVVGPVLLGVVSYWLSVFLIRGFRAIPDGDTNKEGEQAGA